MVTTPKRVKRVEDLEKTNYVKNFCDIFIEDNDTKQEYLQKWEHVTNNKNVFFKSKTKEEIQENFSVYNPNVSYQEAINLLTEILDVLVGHRIVEDGKNSFSDNLEASTNGITTMRIMTVK